MGRLLYCIRQSKRTYYSIMGGNLLKVLDKKKYYLPSLRTSKGIFVEGKKQAEILRNKYQIPNAIYVPNPKPYYVIKPENYSHETSALQFIFLSRLHPEKGVELILRCAERLNREGFSDKFRIDFYGKPATSDYEQEFRKRIETLENVSYSGVLNLKEEAGYRTLCRYDMMLFPTYWRGEGFPGIVMDAYIAGLPLIASDWHLNTEIITKKTGVIIPPKDEEALYVAMKDCMLGRYDLLAMRRNCLNEAKKYDIKKVLSRHFLQEVGLLD